VSKRSRRSTRIKAFELAAQCLQGQVAVEGNIGSRMMSLVIFFENYIDQGATATSFRPAIAAPIASRPAENSSAARDRRPCR